MTVAVDRAPLLQGLPPVLSPATRLLVLGSFPGAASLAAGQYYAHPRNQFWPLLSAVWAVDLVGQPYPVRLHELHRRGVGLWDLIARCRRQGSLDSAIRDAEWNDFAGLRHQAPRLRTVAHNGGLSARAMARLAGLGFEVHRLPSTSPAHASLSLAQKCAAWRAVLERVDAALSSSHDR